MTNLRYTNTKNDENHPLMIHRLAAMILAGGKSRRFGDPKVLQFFRNQPFLLRISDALLATGLKKIYLVLGYKAKKFQKHLPVVEPLEIVVNPGYEAGQFSSIQAGIRSVGRETPGVVSCLIDQPHLLPYTYRVMIMNACSHPEKIIIPTYHSRGGHPVYIPRALFPEIDSAPAIASLRDILDNHRDQILRVEINDAGILEDIDTKKDLHRLEKWYQQRD